MTGLANRVTALERWLGASESGEELVCVLLHGHDLPGGCKEVLLQQDRVERPWATLRVLLAFDENGRCRACGQEHPSAGR